MNIPVFLTSDSNYAPYMAATIVSIAENTKSYVNFYIIDDGISEQYCENIKKLINLYDNISVEFIKIDTDKVFKSIEYSNLCTHVSIATYNRFLIPDLKTDTDKVIYLDIDIIAVGDIKEIYEYELGTYSIGAVPEQIPEDLSEVYKKILGISKEHKYFNAGVLLMDLQKFRDKNTVADLFDIERKYRQNLLHADQDVLNICFDNNYLILSEKYNYESNNNYNTKPDNIILRHFNTGLKPWLISPEIKTELVQNHDIFWYYMSKTPFYNDVKEKCMYKTRESMHKLRLEKLLEKNLSRNIDDYKKILNMRQITM